MFFLVCLSCQNQMDDDNNKKVMDKDENELKSDTDETVQDPDPTDPEAEKIVEKLLGKWELVQLVRHWDDPDDRIIHEPNGYVEYMADDRFGWFDYKTQEYTLFEGKYWIDHYPLQPNILFPSSSPDSKEDQWEVDQWVLHYEDFLVYSEEHESNIIFLYFSDKTNSNNSYLTFINQDTIKLTNSSEINIMKSYDFIYKRKN